MQKLEILRLDHLVLDSANVEKALNFYDKLPGCSTGIEKGRGFVRIGLQKLNIHSFPPVLSPVAAMPGIGGQRFCLNFCGQEEPLREILAEKGIELQKDGQKIFICDTDNNIVELSCDAKEEKNIFNGIKSLVLPVEDIKRVAEFYSTFLGLANPDKGGGLRYNLKYGYIHLVYDQSRRGSGDFCLLAALPVKEIYKNWDSRNIIREIGLCDRSGALGPLISFYLRDPEGNLLELSNYKKEERWR